MAALTPAAATGSEPVATDAAAAEAAPAPSASATAQPRPQPKKRSRSRSRGHSGRRPPVKDSVTVIIPLDATVDLGIALRRTRAKRIRRLRDLFPDLAGRRGGRSGGKGGSKAEAADDDAAATAEDGDEEGEVEGGNKSTEEGSGNGSGADQDHLDDDILMGGSTGRREDYGSVLDYLEAKYVRGVHITEDAAGEGGAASGTAESDDDSGGE